jgi:hypothetical protein
MARLNPLMRVLVKEARRWRLSYSQFSEYGKPARRHLGLKSALGPRLLSYAALAILRGHRLDPEHHSSAHAQASVLHGDPVSELTRIESADVDLNETKIFIS